MFWRSLREDVSEELVVERWRGGRRREMDVLSEGGP
jgi:hypothetical protein